METATDALKEQVISEERCTAFVVEEITIDAVICEREKKIYQVRVSFSVVEGSKADGEKCGASFEELEIDAVTCKVFAEAVKLIFEVTCVFAVEAKPLVCEETFAVVKLTSEVTCEVAVEVLLIYEAIHASLIEVVKMIFVVTYVASVEVE